MIQLRKHRLSELSYPPSITRRYSSTQSLSESRAHAVPIVPGHRLTHSSFVEHVPCGRFLCGLLDQKWEFSVYWAKDSSSPPNGCYLALQDVMAGIQDVKFPQQERKFLYQRRESPIHCLCMQERGLESHRSLYNVGNQSVPSCRS